MANAGRVEVNIVAVGEDKLSAMLKLLDAQSEKTREGFERTSFAAKSYTESATGLTDKLAALAAKQRNLMDVGLETGPAYAKVNKEINKTVDDLTLAIEEELAALRALGAEQGPLGQARKAQLEGIQSITTAQKSATTAQDAAKTSIASTAAETTKAGGAVSNFTAKLGGTIKPFNEVRERVNALRENVMFFGGALLGFGASITSMLVSLRSEAWTKFASDLKNIAETLQENSDLLHDIDVLLGKKRERTAIEEAAKKARAEYDALSEKIDNGRKAIEESQVILNGLAMIGIKWTSAWQTAQDEVYKSTEKLRWLENDRAKIAERMAELGREAERSAAAQVKLLGQLGLRAAGAALPPAAPADKPQTPRGSGYRKAPEQLPGAQIRMNDEDVFAQIEAGISGLTIAAREGVDISGLFGKALKDEIAVGFWDISDAGLEAADAIMSVSDALTNSMSAAFPDIGSGLTEVTAHMQRYRAEMEKLDEQVKNGASATDAQKKATDNLTTTIIGSGTAIAAGVAKQLGGLRAEYIVRSAGEFAAGVATSFTNPAEAASHFSASVLYGIAAAKAGGGGGGGGGRGGGGGGTQRTSQTGQVTGSGSGGGGTTVFNFSTLVTDRQQVRQAVNQVMARRDRSGYRQREGA